MAGTPSIGLIGAGAVGSLLAAAMLENGHPFMWAVRSDARRSELDAGLRLRFPDAATYPLDQVAITASAAELAGCEWLLLAVKSHQVEEVLSQLPPGRAADKTLVVANGLHPAGRHVGILSGGGWLDQGVLVTTHHNKLIVGELSSDDGHEIEHLGEWMRLLHSSLLSVGWPDHNLLELIWSKLAKNCIINPLTALLDVPNGELLGRLDSPLITGLLAELEPLVLSVQHEWYATGPGFLREELRELIEATSGNSSSMREDLRHGRQTEIRQMNIAAAEAGAASGIACPLTRALGEMVLALEGRPLPRVTPVVPQRGEST
jgi:2-dehydropantoate 2-reductase